MKICGAFHTVDCTLKSFLMGSSWCIIIPKSWRRRKGHHGRKVQLIYFWGALFCCLSHTRHLEHAVFWLITSQRLAMSTTCSNITLFSTRTPCDDGANKAFEYKITGCYFEGRRFQDIKKVSSTKCFVRYKTLKF